jgi:hypothetical protein
MAARRKFSQLPKAARDRAARIGDERYGLTRRQVRERYNRGTYNPFARGSNAELRIPREFRNYAQETPGGQLEVNWRDAAYANMYDSFGPGSRQGERHKWNNDTVYYHTQVQMSERMAQVIALASKSELEAWAAVQPFLGGEPPDATDAFPGLPPDITMDDIGWHDANGNWHSIFWYH